MRRLVCAAIAAALGSAALVLGATNAFADVPTNDEFGTAQVISALPFDTTEDTSQATTADADPFDCENGQSVWFSYTAPANQSVAVDINGTDYLAGVAIYTGTAADLTQVACREPFDTPTRTVFAATAGTTYHIMIGTCCGSQADSLVLSVSELHPPANDDFANATVVQALPFTDRPDLTSATRQPGEPKPSCVVAADTVWYSYTPTEPITITGRTLGDNDVTLYTGTSLANLTELTCAFTGAASVRALPGHTYYFQVDNAFSRPDVSPFTITAAGDPEVDFFTGPFGQTPDIFSPVDFSDNSTDPAFLGFATQSWDFGDGSTGQGSGVRHQYTRDGDYTVRHTVVTTDGRSGSASKVIQVRTHDISVVRMTAPRSSRVNRTVSIDVFVSNTRYADTVRVILEASAPNVFGNFVFVGSAQQLVPVKQHGTTRFTFSYTFTAQDAAVGKVSFRATADDLDGTDALPGDNVLISSPPTTVTGANQATAVL